jgi:hypothetical protein
MCVYVFMRVCVCTFDTRDTQDLKPPITLPLLLYYSASTICVFASMQKLTDLAPPPFLLPRE